LLNDLIQVTTGLCALNIDLSRQKSLFVLKLLHSINAVIYGLSVGYVVKLLTVFCMFNHSLIFLVKSLCCFVSFSVYVCLFCCRCCE